MSEPIPVALFAYARPDHLRRTLDCLRENRVPLLYVFSDGPRTPDKAPAVTQVRQVLHAIDWCDVRLCEREKNLGLGRSILTGVTDVLGQHDSAIVFEDDLICVPGTYPYLCAALDHYRDEPAVMSVTGWTHPRVIPRDVTDQPYFDGRAECLVWGTWARAWRGMDQSAQTLIQQCRARGIDIYRYGADLPVMAEEERWRNIWAVRFLYLHILRGGLCLRPPRSLVEHTGADSLATNALADDGWANPPLQPCPPLPREWPAPVENPECATWWQIAYGDRPIRRSLIRRIKDRVKWRLRQANLWPSNRR
jgi:hypothetical protein